MFLCFMFFISNEQSNNHEGAINQTITQTQIDLRTECNKTPYLNFLK